ncbi:MAG: flippase-like domain-containing protein [Synergistetes bacterium]|nr:flippase-like domain-containing protein [Synergistota bacterium]MCX8128366.1 flippase-like domain-containing protein [Synergistota bacterium]MDW8192976.1 flippase-like domain-containing protein [Synergistota bacterium]
MKGTSLKKGLFIFLLITFTTAFFVIFFTISKETISALFKLNKLSLLLAFSCIFASWTFEFLRFRELIRAAGWDISFLDGLVLVWINYFGCAVTPLQSGGGPFQIYVLYRKNVPIGIGFAVTLIRTLITLIILSFAGPIIIFAHPEMTENALLKGMMIYVSVFLVGVSILIFISLKRVELIRKIAMWVVLFLHRLGLFRKVGPRYVIRRINKEIELYNDNFRVLIGKGKRHLALAIAYSFLQLLAHFLALPSVMWGMGLSFELDKVLMIQAVFLFILYFVPTPGGSGVAEGGAAILFRYVMPAHMAGVMAVLWRFFTDYIPIILGGIVTLKIFGLRTLEEVMKPGEEGLQ